MAVATDDSPADGGNAAYSPNPALLVALMEFVGALWAMPIVQRIAIEAPTDHFAVWILLREGSRSDEERVFMLERQFRSRIGHESLPIDIHVFALNEVKESALPPAKVIFER
jgi:hypothetical protein